MNAITLTVLKSPRFAHVDLCYLIKKHSFDLVCCITSTITCGRYVIHVYEIHTCVSHMIPMYHMVT